MFGLAAAPDTEIANANVGSRFPLYFSVSLYPLSFDPGTALELPVK